MANYLIRVIQKDLQNIGVWCDEGSHPGTVGGGQWGVESYEELSFKP